MSTILDALRKVERDRDPATEPASDASSLATAAHRRRFPVIAIVLCAALGFAGGAISSWFTSERAIDVAELPVPPPPPDIDVPLAPTLAQPEELVAPPPAVVTGVDKVEAPKVDAAAASPEAPVVAAIDRESALEPSPFGTARENVPANAAVAPDSESPGQPASADSPAQPSSDRELAALTPETAPAEPHADIVPEEEPEPEAPPETLFDTGRSPPGAPKVALSFLQWSSDPARRFAFISIDGAPTQRVHEGEVTAGLTVTAIMPTGVQFKREGTIFVIRPRH